MSRYATNSDQQPAARGSKYGRGGQRVVDQNESKVGSCTVKFIEHLIRWVRFSCSASRSTYLDPDFGIRLFKVSFRKTSFLDSRSTGGGMGSRAIIIPFGNLLLMPMASWLMQAPLTHVRRSIGRRRRFRLARRRLAGGAGGSPLLAGRADCQAERELLLKAEWRAAGTQAHAVSFL